MRLSDAPHRPSAPADAIKAGVAFVPEDRLQDAVFRDQSIATNIALPALKSYFRRGRVAQDRLERDAAADVRRFLIKANDAKAMMSALSGGNQQKVVIARWLRLRPRLLLLDEPTQGVDVSARAEIYRLLREAADAGTAAVLVASDFEELTTFCDRIVVIRGGRIAGELRGEAMTPHRVAELALNARSTTP
jgi:ribose transport system ATP-binding protein